jgi:hypothetical protein
MSDVQAYFHCRHCLQSGAQDDLQIGAIDPETLCVECASCGSEVGRFTLKNPLPPMNCADCGKPLGPGHKH